MATRESTLSRASIESIAGLTAGSTATLAVHPLDIVKTRMQIHRQSITSGAPSPTARSIFRHLTEQKNSLAALYRGLTPNLVGNAAGWASFFFFKSRYEHFLSMRHGISSVQDPHDHHLAPWEYFTASAMAGATTTMLTNPIWVLKTRMLSSDGGEKGAYRGMGDGIRCIWRAEGLQGFYKGVLISLVGVLHGAVQFTIYDPLKKMYLAAQASHILPGAADTDTRRRRLDNQGTVVISTVAKLVAGIVTYPYQVVRARVQNYEAEKRFGRGVRGVVARIWREEGARGFYRGLGPGVFRVLPATWVTFLVYENGRHFLEDM